jgi:hypothetical protein
MASNGDRFEGAYNKIDALLRKKIGGTKILSFSSVVTEAARKDPTVYRNKEDLLEYGDLRNAIVHDRGKTPVLLADPREDVVEKIEKLWNRLSHPRLLRSIARPVPLRIFAASAVLAESLSYIRGFNFPFDDIHDFAGHGFSDNCGQSIDLSPLKAMPVVRV